MTGLVDTLEGDGLVLRGADPHDRRKVIVSLSQKGRDLLTRVLPGHFRFISALLRPLDRAERGQLVELLRKIVAQADELSAAQPAATDSPEAR
jgi:DNA-binding MarR family transcriptional regulator